VTTRARCEDRDFGKDYLGGIQAALGKDHSKMAVFEQFDETTNATIDTQIINLKSSGADVLMNIASIRFAAMWIRKMAGLGEKPMHFPNSASSGVSATLEPADFGILWGSSPPTSSKQRGDDSKHENVTRQTAHLEMELPMLLLVIKIKIDDFFPLNARCLQRFDGRRWVVVGDLLQEPAIPAKGA
jgi:hypothetical protein